MSEKIIFFTAASTPTEAEVAKIAALNQLAAKPYDVVVRNGRARVQITAATISAANSDKSINDSANNFLKAGFLPGMVVSIIGFTGNTANNLKNKTIDTVTAGKMKFVGTSGSAIVDDAAGETVTIALSDHAFYGASRRETADYVAGTVPPSYYNADDGLSHYPIFDVDNPPDAPTLPDTQTVLSDGESVELDTAGTVTFAVEDGEITEAELAATEAVVTNGDTLALGSDSVTATVAGNAVTGVALPATKCVVATAQVIPVTGGGSVALTIAGGAITGCAYTPPG